MAGVFYALAAFAAARHSIGYLRRDGPQGRTVQPALAGRVATQPDTAATRIALCLILAMMAGVWAFRSAGVHHMLQVQGFKVRNDWVSLEPDRLADLGYRSDARARALAAQLRRDALVMRTANPYVLPRWADRWWGE